MLASCSSGGSVIDNAFVYFPTRGWVATPSDAGLPFEDRWIATADGERLHAWYVPHPQPRATVLHFHGNAGNVSHRVALYARLASIGLSVLAVDYRGYGHSSGRPHEAGLYEDGRAAWAELTGRLGVPPQRIVVAGRSLGSAVALALAAEQPPRGLVLETPFTSLPDLARAHYPFLPVGWLLSSRFDSLARAPRVHVPTLIIAARDDEIVPQRLVDTLYDALANPAGRLRLAGSHNDFDRISAQPYAQGWTRFLRLLDAHAGDPG